MGCGIRLAFESFAVFTGVLVAVAAIVAFVVYRLLLERHIPRQTNADLMDPHVPGVNPETKTGDPSGFELASNNANIPPDPSPKGDQDPPLIQSHEFEFSSPSSPPLSSAAQFDNIDSSNDSQESSDEGERPSIPIEVPAVSTTLQEHKDEPIRADDLTTSEAPAPFPEEINITTGTPIPTDITAVTTVASPTDIATPVIVIAAPKRKRAPRTKRLPSAGPATTTTTSSLPRRRRSSSKSKSSALVSAVSGSGVAADSPPCSPLTEASGSISHTEDGAGSTEAVATNPVANNENQQQTQT